MLSGLCIISFLNAECAEGDAESEEIPGKT